MHVQYVYIMYTRYQIAPSKAVVEVDRHIKAHPSGECRDVIPTKLQCQTIQRALQSLDLFEKNKITIF